MTATVIQFPVIPRPVPILEDSRYRRGVTDFLAAILREQRGYDLDRSHSEAARLTAMTLDHLPQNFGEGEAS
jgi:hypothetical protein